MIKLTGTEKFKIWHKPLKWAIYALQAIDKMQYTQLMHYPALKKFSTLKVCYEENVTQYEKLNKIYQDTNQFPLFAWPQRKERESTQIEKETLKLLKSERIDNWIDKKVYMNQMIDFYSKARTCHKCLKNNLTRLSDHGLY